MSVMGAERWRKLEPLLDQALELSPDERAEWLHTLRTTSPDLAADLDRLLAGEAAADREGFLARPVEVSLAGIELGGYTLERPLGQGGTGSVWLARRSDGRYEGKAAVKLLNLALLSHAGQERFRHEGSVLARLTHPGIARLLDAGVSPSGQPYLVLEHVDGKPIDVHAREHRLGITDCVRLFLQVLDAVGHAHASLIVHRDLKPTNILVTATGDVKLLDFGIAKLLEPQLGPNSQGKLDRVSLELGGALTPYYAAPEQVTGAAITTATDVYSAGVLLYLLLSGRHPTADGLGSHADVLAALLDEAPAPLGLGDLDAILTKALAKSPAERYGAMAAFSEDLNRWMRHEPVSARPLTFGYRARKFLRRNRGAVAAAAVVVVLTAAFVQRVVADRTRVREALAEATLATRKAERVTDFAVGLFEATERGSAFADTVTARNLLARGTTRARELSGQPPVQAQMLDLIGRIQLDLGEYQAARPLLEEALALRTRTFGENHADVATSLIHLARVEGLLDISHERAVPLLRRAFVIRRRLFGDTDARTMDVRYELAMALHMAGDVKSARPLLDEWIASVEGQPLVVTPERAEQLASLSAILQYGPEKTRAEQLARQALAVYRALYGPRHHRVGWEQARLGSLLTGLGKMAEADTMLRSALVILRANYPDGHPMLANALRNRGLHLNAAGRQPESEPVWRETAEMYRRFSGEQSLEYANSLQQLGYTLGRLDRYVEAESVARRSLAILREITPPSSAVRLRGQAYLGEALRGQGRYAEAEPLLLDTYGKLEKGGALHRAGRRLTAGVIARLYDSMSRPAEAARFRAVRDSLR